MAQVSRRVRALFAAAGCYLTLFGTAEGANKTWIGPVGSGSRSTALNWNPNNQPIAGDAVFLTQSDASNRTVVHDAAAGAGTFTVTVNATGAGTISLLRSATTTLNADVLSLGTTGSGRLSQSSGTLSVGSFILASGTSGFGSANFTGGRAEIANALVIGAAGTASFSSSPSIGSGVILNAGSIVLGQSSGAAGSFTFGGVGGSGTVTAGVVIVGAGGNGSFSVLHPGFALQGISIGTLVVGDDVGGAGSVTANHSLSSGTTVVGRSGAGTLIANFSVNLGVLTVGQTGNGFLSTTSGTVNATNATIGASGSGTLEMTGTANFNAGTSSVVFGLNGGSSGRLVMSGGSFTAGSLTVGQAGAGTVSATGGTITFSGAIVGASAIGTLELGGTGVINSPGATLVFGQNTGGSGRLLMNDGTLTTGTLALGGQIDAAGDGTAIGTMTAGRMTLTNFRVGSGDSTGSDGTFTQNAGTISATTISLGSGTSASGTINLVGGFLSASSRTLIGEGTSALGRIFQSGGTLSTGSLIVGNGPSSSGTYSLTGGQASIFSGRIDVAMGTNALGRILHSGGSFSAATRLAQIGVGLNSSGTLAISGTADHALGTLTLGAGTSSTGTLTVSGGTLTIGSGTTVFSVGSLGNGRAVQTGGLVDVNGTLAIADTLGSTGSYSFSAGTLDVLNLRVGRGGNGTLSVSGGNLIVPGVGYFGAEGGSATLLVSGTGQATFSSPGGLEIASTLNSSPGDGYARVSGGTLSVTDGSLVIGRYGTTGTLEQFGGAIIVAGGTTPDIQLANSNGTATFAKSGGTTEGRALIVGLYGAATYQMSGGTLTLSSQFSVANNNGSVDVVGWAEQANGVITATSVRVGIGVASVGTFAMSGGSFSGLGSISEISASGGDGTLLLSGDAAMTTSTFRIGSTNGTGWVSIDDAASLSVTSLTLLNGGRLLLNNGTLTASSITFGSAAIDNGATFSFTGGRLQLTSPTFTLNLAHDQLLGENLMLDQSKQLSMQGTLNVAGQAQLTLDGGRLTVGTLVVGPDAAFNHAAGTLAFALSSPAVGTGGVLGQSVSLSAGKAITVAPSQQVSIQSDGLLEATGGYVDAGGTLAIAVGGQARVSSPGGVLKAVNLANSGVLEVAGGRADFANVLANTGEIALTGPSAVLSASTSFANGGLLRGSGAVQAGSFVNVSAGKVRAGAGESLRILSAAGVANDGTIELAGGEVDLGIASLANAGRITGRGILAAAAVANTGTMSLSAGVSDVIALLDNSAGGKTIVTGAANATFHGPVNNTGSSEFRVSAASFATFLGPVTGLSSFTGPGSKIFEDSASFGRIVTPGGNTFVGPGGAVTAEHIREASLSIEGTFAVLPDPSTAGVSRLNALTIAGATNAWDGTLDLASNGLVIDYDGGSPVAVIANQLRSGHALGAWTGNGIRSSTAAVIANRAIGFAEASALGSPGSFLAQPIDGTTLLLRFTLPGDSNLDTIVDIGDFALLAANFNAAGSTWFRGDYNYDSATDIGDFALLAANFNQSLPTDTPRAPAVPEPGVAGLALLGALAGRRRSAARSLPPVRFTG